MDFVFNETTADVMKARDLCVINAQVSAVFTDLERSISKRIAEKPVCRYVRINPRQDGLCVERDDCRCHDLCVINAQVMAKQRTALINRSAVQRIWQPRV